MRNRTPLNRLTPGHINDRPILTILDELSVDQLSRLAADVMRENRRRLDLTQSLFEQIEDLIATGTEDEELRHAYRLALLELKIFHELVRIVVDVLGFVPKVPPESELH